MTHINFPILKGKKSQFLEILKANNGELINIRIQPGIYGYYRADFRHKLISDANKFNKQWERVNTDFTEVKSSAVIKLFRKIKGFIKHV